MAILQYLINIRKQQTLEEVKDLENKIPKITGFMFKDLKERMKRRKTKKDDLSFIFDYLFKGCRVLLIDFCVFLLWTSFENHKKSSSLLFCFLIMT